MFCTFYKYCGYAISVWDINCHLTFWNFKFQQKKYMVETKYCGYTISVWDINCHLTFWNFKFKQKKYMVETKYCGYTILCGI